MGNFGFEVCYKLVHSEKQDINGGGGVDVNLILDRSLFGLAFNPEDGNSIFL
jgi:hypothetical protein